MLSCSESEEEEHSDGEGESQSEEEETAQVDAVRALCSDLDFDGRKGRKRVYRTVQAICMSSSHQ